MSYRKEWRRSRFYDCPSLVILGARNPPRNQFWHPLFVFLPPSHTLSQPFPPFSPFMASFSYLFPYECAFGGLLNGLCKRKFPHFPFHLTEGAVYKFHRYPSYDFSCLTSISNKQLLWLTGSSSLCIPREKRSSA